MPVILDPDCYDLWLDPGMKDVTAASELLKPRDARLMRCYPVSNRINPVANDDEECSRPIEVGEVQKPLFSVQVRPAMPTADLSAHLPNCRRQSHVGPS